MNDETKKPGMNALANGAAKSNSSDMGSKMASAVTALSQGLLKPGKYTLVATDVRSGDPKDGVTWGVIAFAVEGAAAHDELALIVPVEVADGCFVQVEGGGWALDPEKFTPGRARNLIGGHRKLAGLVAAAGLEEGSIDDPDDLALLLGVRVVGMVARGTDSLGLPNHSVVKVIAAAPLPEGDPIPASCPGDTTTGDVVDDGDIPW